MKVFRTGLYENSRISLVFLFLTSLLIGCTDNHRGPLDWYRSWAAQTKLAEAERWSDMRQFGRAEKVYREVLEYHRRPESVKAWTALGDLNFSIQSYDEALRAYDQALAMDSNAYEATSGRWGTMLQKSFLADDVRRRVDGEIRYYISRAPVGPASAEYLYAAYKGLDYMHDDGKKIELRNRIVRQKPDEELLNSLAEDASEDIFAETEIPKRLSMIELFYSLFPPSRYSNLVHQNQLRLLADDPKQLEQLRQAGEDWLSREPDNRTANYVVGYWFTEKDLDMEKAITALRRALDLIRHPNPADKPDNVSDRDWKQDLRSVEGRYFDSLGWALHKTGRDGEAMQNLESAMTFLEFDHRLYYHLGVLYEDQGLMKKAIDAYLRSVEAGDEIPEASSALERLATTAGSSPKSLHSYFAKREGITPYTDVTEKSGLGSIRGRRVAWGDYDGDGYDDLLVNGRRLFRNNRDGTFTEVTKLVGLDGVRGSIGGVWADFNNDGRLDFYMMGDGNGTYGRFWKNSGKGNFTNVTAKVVERPNENPEEGAGWGDYNGDGWPDLYVADYELPKSRAIRLGIGTPDVFWRNNGDGTFTDASRQAGLASPEPMNGRGVNWGDYNNDGFPDILVSNYRLDPNFLWRNNGDGTFTNVARDQGVEGVEKKGQFGNTMGSEWGDYNNDGNLDLFSGNLAHPRYIGYSDKSILHQNGGPRFYLFTNQTGPAGIRYRETDSEPSFGDYDNDGNLDLFIANVYPKGSSVLYKNDGRGKFIDVTWLAGVRVTNSWTSAFADFDRDGYLDLVVASPDGIRLFKNDGSSNHWLQVSVTGRRCNRDGIGSRVTVKSPRGIQIREVEGGKGTGSQNWLPVEFGFGNYDGPVDVKIRNSCGQVLEKSGVRLDQMVRLTVE